jgi:hypothetical protein
MSSRNPTSPSILRTASPKPFSECCNGRCGAVLTRPHDPPVLFKTIVYWAVVFLVRFLEKLIEYLFAGGTLSEIPEYVATHFSWHRFAAIRSGSSFCFLIYTSVAELNARLGDGELRKIFFTRRLKTYP